VGGFIGILFLVLMILLLVVVDAVISGELAYVHRLPGLPALAILNSRCSFNLSGAMLSTNIQFPSRSPGKPYKSGCPA
jgi:hypothetical protein